MGKKQVSISDSIVQVCEPMDHDMRVFESGATRNVDTGKPRYAGFLSPEVLQEFGRYMLRHQTQADGTTREPDNWKKGIPIDAYMESLLRHVIDIWQIHANNKGEDFAPTADVSALKEALSATMFNTMGYLYEILKSEEEQSW